MLSWGFFFCVGIPVNMAKAARETSPTLLHCPGMLNVHGQEHTGQERFLPSFEGLDSRFRLPTRLEDKGHCRVRVELGLCAMWTTSCRVSRAQPLSLCISLGDVHTTRGRGGSIGRASDSRFNGFHDPGSNPARSTRKTCEFFSQQWCFDSLSVCPTSLF